MHSLDQARVLLGTLSLCGHGGGDHEFPLWLRRCAFLRVSETGFGANSQSVSVKNCRLNLESRLGGFGV